MAIIIWARRFQPAALALTLAAWIVALTWAIDGRFDGIVHYAAITVAAAVGVVMLAGWVRNSQRILAYGYLFSFGLWCFITWAAIANGLTLTTILLAGAWGILAGGSYLLEVLDGDGRWLP